MHLVRDDRCLTGLDTETIRIETPHWLLEVNKAFHLAAAATLGNKGKLILPNGEEVKTLGEYYDGSLLAGNKPPCQTNWLAAYRRKPGKKASEKIAEEVDRLKLAEAESINQGGLEAQVSYLTEKHGQKVKEVVRFILDTWEEQPVSSDPLLAVASAAKKLHECERGLAICSDVSNESNRRAQEIIDANEELRLALANLPDHIKAAL